MVKNCLILFLKWLTEISVREFSEIGVAVAASQNLFMC